MHSRLSCPLIAIIKEIPDMSDTVIRFPSSFAHSGDDAAD
jgi:hypothetical protein